MKYITIGRHEFTPTQKVLLNKAGLVEEVGRIEQVQDVKQVIEKAKEIGAEAIVVQALPMPLLAQLLQLAAREGLQVYGFRIQALSLANSEEEAKKLAEQHNADIISPSREGKYRVSKTVALQQLKRIVIEAEDVATL